MSRFGAALLLAALFTPSVAEAQGGPGFLFKRPNVSLRFETGYGMQSVNSDVFHETRREFTVKWRDFDGPYVGAELAVRVTEQWDVGLGVGFQERSVDSEYRDWVDNNNLPIEQTTSFMTVPVTVTGRYYFNPRGRTVGSFAWVPNRFSPYVGGGIGFVAYKFSQEGDFIDFTNSDIFYDYVESVGEGALARALAGATLSIGKQFELLGEARYTLSSAEMDRNWNGFDPIDLNGFQVVAGVSVRF